MAEQIGKEEQMQDEVEQRNVVTIEAPYRDAIVCKFCGRKFTVLQNLRRHIKNQHLGFRYPCLSCSTEVTRREDIIRHYLSFHPDKLEEAYSIRQVSKTTEDGKVAPRRRTSRRSNNLLSPLRNKRRKREVRLSERMENQDFISPESLASTTTENLGRTQGEDNQRVVIALDPVTQFRLERVISERVDRVTERSVIETLNKSGRVTRRETIEREYFLKN